MEKNAFDFWKDHSDNYLEMALSGEKREVIQHPDGYGNRTGECGDTIEIFLVIRNDRIQNISFDTNGCMNSIACANTVVRLAEGKTITRAWEITPEDVIAFLETLPTHENHCAELAVGALYLALSNYQDIQRAPWKKLYKR